jgi:hypothetical protein
MPILVFPSEVRAQVLEQHAELRGLLVQVIAEATPDARPDARPDVSADRLALTARRLCERFGAHVTFEEEELGRIFAVLDAWGPERVRELHLEHRRQRDELDALRATAESGGEVGPLATALRALAVNLMSDMEKEESGCLQTSPMFENSLPFERS